MEETDALAVTIGKNITRLRKLSGMTQSELAEQLNYSDKSVSKWEQGNGIPDIHILVRLAELFGVPLDDLVREHAQEKVMPRRTRFLRRLRVLILSAGLCWLAAVVCFVLVRFVFSDTHGWLSFLYAVPASAIVVLVFSCIWRYRTVRIISISVLIWTVLGCAFCTAMVFGQNIWYVFLIGVPLQLLAMLFFTWWRRSPFVK